MKKEEIKINKMLESSQDILNILLGFSILWLVLWLSYLLWQLSKTLRLINKTVEGVKYALEGFNELLKKIKGKVNSTGAYFTVLLKSGQKILEMIEQRKGSKKPRRKRKK